MNNNKQNSIQWLIEKIHFDANTRCYSQQEWHLIFEQAKQMEKEQIEDAYREGRSDQQSAKDERFYHRNAELYYNETFRNNND